MQPNTGQILGMVGSIDYNAVKATDTPDETGNVLDGNVNVTTRERQPGSALKPFTYLSAMNQGALNPGSVLWDVETKFPVQLGATDDTLTQCLPRGSILVLPQELRSALARPAAHARGDGQLAQYAGCAGAQSVPASGRRARCCTAWASAGCSARTATTACR